MRYRECTFYMRKYVIGRILIWHAENLPGQTEFQASPSRPIYNCREVREG